MNRANAKKGGKACHEKHDYSGKNNPHWKGGITKNNYHYKKIQQERYPERVKARDILNKAIRAGKIRRPDICPKCNKKRKVHAHHKDYSKPLDVKWLCRSCHRELHGGMH